MLLKRRCHERDNTYPKLVYEKLDTFFLFDEIVNGLKLSQMAKKNIQSNKPLLYTKNKLAAFYFRSVQKCVQVGIIDSNYINFVIYL